MSHFKVTIILFLSFSMTISFGQSISIKGQVKDAQSGEWLEGVTVYVESTQKGSYTNKNGLFEIDDLLPNQYHLMFSILGYAPKEIDINAKDTDDLFIDVELEATSLNLSEIIVTNKANFGGAISVISNMDLALRPTKSSQDLLKLVPGLFIAQHAGGGKSEQLFLRGFDLDHGTDIAISVDGMPVNLVSHAHGQGYADLHFLIPETVKKMDFNKGLYYAEHGDFNTAGYVDFQTKDALNQNLVKFEIGRFNTFRTVGLFDLIGPRNGKTSAYLATEFMSGDGPFEAPQNFRRLNLMGKLSHKFNDDNKLTFSISHFKSDWDASGQIPSRAVKSKLISRFGAIDSTEGGQTNRTNIQAKWLTTLGNNQFVKQQAYYSKNIFQLYSNFTFFLNDPVNGDQISQYENRNLFGYKFKYGVNLPLGGTELFSEVGFDIRMDNTNGTLLAHTKSRTEILEQKSFGDINQTNMALYFNENWSLTDKLSLKAGLRFDHFKFGYRDLLKASPMMEKINKNIISPKASLEYTLNPSTQFYLKMGTGFHSNDSRVVTAQNGDDVLPKAFGFDIGTFIKPMPKLLINLAAWRLDLDQEFVYVGDEGIVEAGGKTKRIGLDLSVRYQIGDFIFLDADMNYTIPKSSEASEGQDFIPLAPTFTSIAGISSQFKNGLNFSLRYRLMGDRAANEYNTLTAPGYFLLDGGVSYKYKDFEFTVNFENILNTEWNEAQFETESRLFDEPESVTELHFTPGTPFNIKAGVAVLF